MTATILQIQKLDTLILAQTTKLYERLGGRITCQFRDCYILSDLALYHKCSQHVTKKVLNKIKQGGNHAAICNR